jgi:hypothetical protein
LGPVTAQTHQAAAEIIARLFGEIPGSPVFWDVPDRNQAAHSAAQRLGFTRQRPLVRMFRGANPGGWGLGRLFGILGPGFG